MKATSMKTITKIDRILSRVLEAICLLCAGCLLLILLFNVFFRLVPLLSVFHNFSMGWFDEIVQTLTAWMIMTGAAILARRKEHFVVDLIPVKLRGRRIGCLYDIFISLITLAFCVGLCYYGWELMARAVQHTPVLKIPMRVLYASIPANMFLMCVYEIADIAGNIRKLTQRTAEQFGKAKEET